MELSIVPDCAMLEGLVVLFQVAGVAALCLSRLFPGTRWAERGRLAYILALVGLGIAGAWCGQHDSQFALFAGVTITLLLIGMIIGAGSIDLATPSGRSRATERALAG